MSRNVHQAWLAEAYALLRRELVPEAREDVIVSYGFPQGRGGRKKLGICHYEPDGVDVDVIFVRPSQWTDPQTVLKTLLHEALHTAARHAGHRGEFVKLAKRVGFTGPWTYTPSTPELDKRLNALAAKLPPFPAAAFDIQRGRKGSRLRLYECQCRPPRKIRAGTDDLLALCLYCGAEFIRVRT